MKVWIKFWAVRFGMGAACLVVIVNTAMQTTVAVTVGRAAAVGFVVYIGTLFMGGMVGNALLTLVAQRAAEKEEKKRSESEQAGVDLISDSVTGTAAETSNNSRAA